MTRNEALKAMIDGKKVKHSSFGGRLYLVFISPEDGFKFVTSSGVREAINGSMDYGTGYNIHNPPRTIVIDGRDIELSETSYQELKRQMLKEGE